MIIDTPDDPVNIMNACNDITVEGIFITHTHPEQLQGLHPIREATGAEVWISAVDANVLTISLQLIPKDLKTLSRVNHA